MATKDIIRDIIRNAMADSPGIELQKLAEQLGIHRNTVSAHVAAIRAEWLKKDAGQ